MKQQQQQETKGPSPIPNSAEMTNIDDILDNATKAMETLQQKALAADKKVEIANLIKAMAETIVTLKTRDHQPNEHSHYECHEAFQSIKQELAEIRASMSSNLKTYAQRAAAAPPFTTPQNIPPRQPQLTQVRKERALYEVTLSARGADGATKDKLAKDSHKAISEKLQQAINAADLPTKPALKSVNKMSKNTFRLYFKTTEEAELIKNATIDWNIAYEGLATRKPKYGLVVHGVPMEAINLTLDHTATLQDWEEQNEGLKISNIAPLKRHSKHTPAAKRSLIVFTHDRDAANKCLSQGLFIDNYRYSKLEKYAPHLYICQCFKCHRYGHRASECDSNVVCGHCAHEGHTAEQCSNSDDPPKCINCKGEHAAWHRECSATTKEVTKLTELRMETSYLFQ